MFSILIYYLSAKDTGYFNFPILKRCKSFSKCTSFITKCISIEKILLIIVSPVLLDQIINILHLEPFGKPELIERRNTFQSFFLKRSYTAKLFLWAGQNTHPIVCRFMLKSFNIFFTAFLIKNLSFSMLYLTLKRRGFIFIQFTKKNCSILPYYYGITLFHSMPFINQIKSSFIKCKP